MLYPFGVFLLVAGGLLFAVFSRAWLGDGTGHGSYPISFDELFYWGQWAAFWLTLAALVTFAFCRWKGQSWRLAAPVIGVGLCLHFIVFSMPLLENRFEWPRGALGWKVFLAAKQRERALRDRERHLQELFTGTWTNPKGARLLVSDNRARFEEAGVTTELGAGALETFSLEPRSRMEYELARCGLNQLRNGLSDREYPLFVVRKAAAPDSLLLLLNPHQLLLIIPGVSSHLLSRQGRAG
ncbi:hypothetical protein [Paludibaculum fermentans]|uniref:Uncharacterized protein n=1 Tax=Paludibaculum fermentans TaxID=1473598 RepID=A0A7S7SNA3_PALFE|nr:hypothetical protein [Paludibaculum fermentans]QOY90351.1 hypothetical protein IRI77_10465 [Paludibaculum fermentans]